MADLLGEWLEISGQECEGIPSDDFRSKYKLNWTMDELRTAFRMLNNRKVFLDTSYSTAICLG